jgi:hypothetical protein
VEKTSAQARQRGPVTTGQRIGLAGPLIGIPVPMISRLAFRKTSLGQALAASRVLREAEGSG